MPITEPNVQTNQYLPDPASLSNHYVLPNWQFHHDLGDYQQPMQFQFPPNDIPPFDFELSQPGIYEPIPIIQPISNQYAPDAPQTTQRRLSLQPLRPQTPSGDARARSASLTTPGYSPSSDTTQRDIISRTASPGAAEPEQYGYPVDNGSWRCSYPDCRSTTVFRRACDLRKHYKRHFKRYFCSYGNCPHHSRGGFSSKKDRDRHEASHNPSIPCSHPECNRIFSRVDNMVSMPSSADEHELTTTLERSCEKNSWCSTSQDKAWHELISMIWINPDSLSSQLVCASIMNEMYDGSIV